jgi:POT family proton-dependent oligopeptide transporter
VLLYNAANNSTVWLIFPGGNNRPYRYSPEVTLSSLQHKLRNIPEGSAHCFYSDFRHTGFCRFVFHTGAVRDQKLGFTNKDATAIMGVFGAFNYGLHLFGGYLGGRFISNRNLFVGGMVLQVLGCAAISLGSHTGLYWGLALFLTGSGLNVTCLNMMLTQRFKPEDDRRESAFLWNYAGMNLGFFIGFLAAGEYQLREDYSGLFILRPSVISLRSCWRCLTGSALRISVLR